MEAPWRWCRSPSLSGSRLTRLVIERSHLAVAALTIMKFLIFTTEELLMNSTSKTQRQHAPWSKGKLIGQKPPLKLKEIRGIRIRLQLAEGTREWRCTLW